MANEKFSQFASGGNTVPGDIVVGLRAGVNTQFTYNNAVNSTSYAPVRLVSVTQLNATYNNGTAGIGATLTENVNGALNVDGFPANLGDRILVAGQLSSLEDGIYVVSQTGSSGAPYILIRATDFDTPAKIVEGASVNVSDGFEYPSSVWVVLQPIPAVIGVNNIVLSSTMEQALIRFAFLQSANNLLDLASPITAYDNISPANSKGEIVSTNGTVSSALIVGANNFVLTADSTQPLGLKWAAPASGFAFTAKGQLITYDGTTIQYLNVGTDGFALVADSTQPDGIKWALIPTGLNFTAKGQLVTYNGTAVEYLNAGTDGFVLSADSTQPDGLNWIAAPPPSFTYPYTFTGNNVLFDFAPTMVWGNANCLVCLDASKNMATTTQLQYFDVGDQLLQGTSFGSVTNSHIAALATDGVNLTANYTFSAATDTTSISTNFSAIVAASSATISPLGDTNFIAAANTAFMNTSVQKCVILGSNSGTINSGAGNCGVICTTGSTAGGVQSAVIGGAANSVAGSRNVIVGGNSNTITSGVNGVIAGGTSNVLNGDHNFIAASNSSTANGTSAALIGDSITCTTSHSFVFNDGLAAQTANTPTSFSIIAARGVAIGGANPNLFCSLDLQETAKALKNNNVAGTSTITTPLAGMQLFDTTTNQAMLYNGSAWVIMA